MYWYYLAFGVALPTLLCIPSISHHNQTPTHRFIISILFLTFIAFTYTTPWDNYLVATKVWWYDTQQVLGLIYGYVPIEEYAFFILQTLFVIIVYEWIYGNQSTPPIPRSYPPYSILLYSTLLVVWAWSTRIIYPMVVDTLSSETLSIPLSSSSPLTYLTIQLAWFLPPIFLQLLFNPSIITYPPLWIVWSMVSGYLCVLDAIAIYYQTWTIDPQQSLHILVGGILPIEEMIFFCITSFLVLQGHILLTRSAFPSPFSPSPTAT